MTLARPSRADAGLMAVMLLFLSASGPIIAATVAPALAIAFWRCILGSGATGVWLLARRSREVLQLTRRELGLIAAAGILLGLHFAAWVPSLRFTSVAASTAIVATQPVWAALIARARGVRIAPLAWLGIGISLLGVIVLTGIDASLDPRALIGDGLALLGAILAAAYISVGEHARKTVSTSTMTFVLYAVSAVTVLVIVIVLRVPLTGFSLEAWALILLLTLTAQLMGHSLMNRLLATVPATVISLTILLELPGAAIIAAIVLGQTPPLSLIPAMALILAGLVLVIRTTRSTTLVETPPI